MIGGILEAVVATGQTDLAVRADPDVSARVHGAPRTRPWGSTARR